MQITFDSRTMTRDLVVDVANALSAEIDRLIALRLPIGCKGDQFRALCNELTSRQCDYTALVAYPKSW